MTDEQDLARLQEQIAGNFRQIKEQKLRVRIQKLKVKVLERELENLQGYGYQLADQMSRLKQQ